MLQLGCSDLLINIGFGWLSLTFWSTVIMSFWYKKVKVSRDRPRWPKGFRVD